MMNTNQDQAKTAKIELDAQTADLFGLRKDQKNKRSSLTKKELYLANPKPQTVGWFAPPPPEED